MIKSGISWWTGWLYFQKHVHIHFGQSIAKCIRSKMYTTLDRTVTSKHVHLVPIGYLRATMYKFQESASPRGKSSPPFCHRSKDLVGISMQNTSNPFLFPATSAMHCLTIHVHRHSHFKSQRDRCNCQSQTHAILISLNCLIES